MILDSVVLLIGCSIVESSDRTHFAIPITVAYLGLLIISIIPIISVILTISIISIVSIIPITYGTLESNSYLLHSHCRYAKFNVESAVFDKQTAFTRRIWNKPP